MKGDKKVKKKVFGILFAVVLVLSLSLVTAVPVAANGTVTNIDTQETFATIQAAIDDDETLDGHTIEVGAGDWDGALVTKSLEIRGEDGAVIDNGPTHGSWTCGFKLISASSGATISHFTFQGLGLPIYGLGIDDVTIEHNKLYDTMQGITNWDGNNWVIKHNVIEGIAILYNSGGIGIAVGSRNSPVSGNLVAHNKIVADIPDDHTFSVGGILLCTDERYGWTPGEVTNNKIVHNRVKITGPKSWAISLQVIGITYPNPSEDEIQHAKDLLNGNIVGFNNLRGSERFVECLPEELEEVNTISRNLGDNRGHGVVPADIFRPA